MVAARLMWARRARSRESDRGPSPPRAPERGLSREDLALLLSAISALAALVLAIVALIGLLRS
jgi:hypothetical protein